MHELSLRAVCGTFRERIIGRKFVQDVGVLTIANFVSAVLSVIQGLLVARWLGPELYGVTALVMSFPSLVHTFFDARSAEVSVKYLSEFHAWGERERALAICKVGYAVDFVIAFITFLVVLIMAPWAARSIVHRPEMAGFVTLFAAAFIPRSFVGTSYAVLATLGRFPLVAVLDAITTALRVVLVLGLVLLGWQVAGVIWGTAAAIAVMGLVHGIVAHVLIRRTWGASWLSGQWESLRGYRRAMIGFYAFNDLNASLGMISKQLDLVLLGYFRNPTEVGHYKLAKSVAGAVGYIVKPLQSVVYPDLARRWCVGDMQSLWERMRKLAVQVGLPLGFVCLLTTAFIPFIGPILAGETYRPAMVASQLLFIGSAVWLSLFWLRPMYYAQGAVKAWTIINIFIVFMSIIGFFISIPLWGYVGLASWQMFMHLLGHGLATIYLILPTKRGS